MEESINMGAQFSVADFAKYSMSVYNFLHQIAVVFEKINKPVSRTTQIGFAENDNLIHLCIPHDLFSRYLSSPYQITYCTIDCP